MFSVVIPNLHSPIIDRVVQAVEAQTMRHRIDEIIVVGQDRYHRVPSTVRSIETAQPLSAAAARNRGAQAARGHYVLFLDADCIAAPDLLAHLSERHTQGYPVVGGGVAADPGSSYWALCDNLLTFAPVLSTTTARSVALLPSLNLSIERELFWAVGGFDEHFPGAAGEDYDLCARLRLRGITLWFEPRAVVAHHHQRMSAGASWQHMRSFGRAQVRLQRRNYGTLTAPRLGQHMRPWFGFILAGAPLLALWDALSLCRGNRGLLPYWYTVPGMAWAKTGWYLGVVESLLVPTPS